MHTHLHRRAVPAMVAVTLSLILSACSDSTPAPNGAETTEVDLRAHYDSLVMALQTELSEMRGDAYITSETLQNRVEALEALLESLGSRLPTEDDTLHEESVSETVIETESETEIHSENESDSETETERESETEAPGISSESQFLYTVSDGKATVIGYRYDSGQASDSQLTIPSTLGGYPVTSIADNAFSGLPVTYVMLPSTLTHIGWFAFSGCLELRVLAVPDTVARIDYGAFENCPNLTVYCPRGSYTARYAAACAIPFEEI